MTAIAEFHGKFELAPWLETIARNLNTFKFFSGVSLAQERTRQLASEYLKKGARISASTSSNIWWASSSTPWVAQLCWRWGHPGDQWADQPGTIRRAELIIFAVLSSFLQFIDQLEYYYDLLARLDKVGYIQELPQEKTPLREIAVQPPSS